MNTNNLLHKWACLALLFICTLNAAAEKTVYIPNEWRNPWNPDTLLYAESDPNNQYTWSKSRSVETDNFIIFWDKYWGKTAPDKLPSSNFFYFDLAYMKQQLEAFYDLEINKLEFVDPETSNVAKYKIMVLLNHTETWTCYGGGYDYMVPALWLNPATSKPVGHSVAHEVGHSFHYMCYAEAVNHNENNSIGTGFHLQVGNGQTIWEQTAQWQANQSFPELMYSQSWGVFRNSHNYAFTHEWHRYQSYWLHYHLADKYGITTVADVWNTPMRKSTNFTTDGCDFNQSLMKLKGWKPVDLYREYYDYAAHCATQDWAACAPYRNAYIGDFNYEAVLTEDGAYQVAMGSCPQSTGFNIIPLEVPAAGTTIKADFTALRTSSKLATGDAKRCMNGETSWGSWAADSYNTSSNGARDSRKGFRLGYVALLDDGTRVYLNADSVYCKGTGNRSAEVEAVVPEGTQRLWMIVSPAPTEYFQHLWDEDLTRNDDFWPYQVSFTGTDIDQATAIVYAQPTLDGRDIADATFEYDLNLALDAQAYTGTTVAISGKVAATLGTAFQIVPADLRTKMVTWSSTGPQKDQIMFYAATYNNGRISQQSTGSTANGYGHWFNASGRAVSYGDSGSRVYSEFSSGNNTFYIGQYPGRCRAGDQYTICQLFRYKDQNNKVAKAAFVFHITMGSTTSVSLRSISYSNPTGIEEIHNSQFTMHNEAGAVYDLSGRRVSVSSVSSVPSVLPKGVYIVNGKKVYINK